MALIFFYGCPCRRKTRNQTTRTRQQRRRKSPPLSATLSISFPSKKADNEPSQVQEQGSLDEHNDSEPIRVSSPAKQRRDMQPSSPAKDAEDSCVLPSSPKTPKQDISVTAKSTNKSSSSSTITHLPSLTNNTKPILLPPTRSRKNLVDRMKLASNDTNPITPQSHSPLNPASTSSNSNTRRTSTRQVSKLSAKELAQKTATESLASSSRQSVEQSHATKSSSLSSDAGGSESSIRRLRGLSAKELAQLTDPERRLSARVAVRRQNKGKSPAPLPTPCTPQLHQFKSFIVESPTKSPRFVLIIIHNVTIYIYYIGHNVTIYMYLANSLPIRGSILLLNTLLMRLLIYPSHTNTRYIYIHVQTHMHYVEREVQIA